MSAAVPQPNVPAELGEKLFLKEGKQAFLDSVEPADLVYFLLNVGDGDTQLFLLPAREADGVRRAFVVDVATTGKLPDLLQTLLGTNLLPRVPDDGYLFPLSLPPTRTTTTSVACPSSSPATGARTCGSCGSPATTTPRSRTSR
jgi:hypothetical protein